MKILIGYDGSECADAALSDLRRAGLPEQAEALVISVADVLMPPPITDEVKNTASLYVLAGVKRAQEHATQAIEAARTLAERARDRVNRFFPKWEVGTEACADTPAWGLIAKADEWSPDLIVVGSHGRSSWGGRLILGSVSQRVLAESHGSVRVGRSHASTADAPVRIIGGTDGSPGAAVALDAVASRVWPKGSEVRVVSVLDTILVVTPDPTEPSVVKWVEVSDKAQIDWAREFFEAQAERLRATGLLVTVMFRKGNPKKMLIAEAAEWKADSIFVGAQGIRGPERFMIGSVSAAVAAAAPCSVEVVRSKGRRIPRAERNGPRR